MISDSYPPPLPMFVEELPIDERSCLPQNYGLRSRSRRQNTNGDSSSGSESEDDRLVARVFDYSIEAVERGDGNPKKDDGNTTKRDKDKCTPITVYTRDWPEDTGLDARLPRCLRVVDFSDSYATANKLFLPKATQMVQEKMKGEDFGKMDPNEQSNRENMMANEIKKFKTMLDPKKIPTLKSSTPVFFSASEPGKALVLGVSLPYVVFESQKGASDASESFSLSEYMHLKRDEDSISTARDLRVDGEARVYKALFIVINDDMVAIFRSNEDNYLDRPPPLFRCQERLSAFRALVSMISNILICPQKKLINSFDDKVSQKVYEVKSHMSRPKSKPRPAQRGSVSTGGSTMVNEEESKGEENKGEENKDEEVWKSLETGEDLVLDLEELGTEISTLKKVTRSQIEILKELRHVYGNTPKATNIHDRNLVHIPVLSGMDEGMRSVLQTIDKVVEDRENFDENLDDLLKQVGASQKSLHRFLVRKHATAAASKVTAIEVAVKLIISNSIPEQTTGINRGIVEQTTAITKAIGDQTGSVNESRAKELKKQTNAINEAIGEQTGSVTTTHTNYTEEIKTQTKSVIEQQAIMQEQRRVMTALMFISMIFLPLGFFASYLGMNEGWIGRPVSEHTVFWAISTPFTIIICIWTCWFDNVFIDWHKRYNKWRGREPGKSGDEEKGSPGQPARYVKEDSSGGLTRGLEEGTRGESIRHAEEETSRQSSHA